MKAYILTAPMTAPERTRRMVYQLDVAGFEYNLVKGVEYKHDPNWLEKCPVDRKKQHYLKEGELCCATGHDWIWQRIMQGPDDYALILEDDADLRGLAAHQVATLAKELPSDFSWAILTEHGRDHTIVWDGDGAVDTANFRRYRLPSYCCHGYLVSKRGAAYLHRCADPIWTQCDALTRFRADWKEQARNEGENLDPNFQSPYNKVFQSKQTLIHVGNYETTIQDSQKCRKSEATFELL